MVSAADESGLAGWDWSGRVVAGKASGFGESASAEAEGAPAGLPKDFFLRLLDDGSGAQEMPRDGKVCCCGLRWPRTRWGRQVAAAAAAAIWIDRRSGIVGGPGSRRPLGRRRERCASCPLGRRADRDRSDGLTAGRAGAQGVGGRDGEVKGDRTGSSDS